MFVPKLIVEKLSAFTEAGLSRILSAKDEQCSAVVKAKQEQIDLLNDEIEGLIDQVAHERARAEAAIDTLLQEKANVAGIRNADLSREQAKLKEEKGEIQNDPGLSEMQRVFQSVSGVGDDSPETEAEVREAALSKFTAIGGLPI